ncbi:MAG: outer membrane protein [Geoalkalibacter sp.]|jgi:OOP family OmpA-OmpF porin|uniref:outer membrane protein n=1 Tax=Geoalkalibacter sp. TaxID=3041440 RepID=UPI002A973020|nr:outer membrane beta-barrel protein [Thermodesulfobacteriota bacterium]
MRWMIFFGVATCITFVTSATAAEQGVYFGANMGAVFLEDSSVSAPVGSSFDIEYDSGMSYGILLGYDAGTYFSKSGNTSGRLEIEYARRSNDADEVEENGVFRPVGGEAIVDSLMINSWVDFRTESPFRPYLGGGLGAARLTLDDAGFSDDDDIRFAYQAGAGIGLPIGNHLTISVGYRYFSMLDATLRAETLDPETDAVQEREYDIEYSSHNIDVGFRFRF